MREIKLQIKDNQDLVLLFILLNNMQNAIIRNYANDLDKIKDDNCKFKGWFDEKVIEWDRIQSLKAQIAEMLK